MKFARGTIAAVLTFSAAACGGGSSIGGLDIEQSYQVALTAASEVPAPKATTATGTVQIVVFPGSIDFLLSASNITGITMAHIHNGAPGVAGPIVVTLFLPSTPTGAVNSVFASGTLTAANLPAGVTLGSLKDLLLSGNAYVNVHTTANPTGEIRGQIK
ncbi:MAG TPA: CHRD domain-containing protein [Gemmatimonadaceae bacterium]|nr:CHRD domain-containing protein [Gemmatimonadaceae bacterium]